MQIIIAIIAALLSSTNGIATMYNADANTVLYCDQFIGPDNTIMYHEDTGPWVALDVNAYGDFASCGDMLLVVFGDGTTWQARALDAGRFSNRWVDDYGPSTPIVIDIPEIWRPDHNLSWPVSVLNLSAGERNGGK